MELREYGKFLLRNWSILIYSKLAGVHNDWQNQQPFPSPKSGIGRSWVRSLT
jgi:hypothetical protein